MTKYEQCLRYLFFMYNFVEEAIKRIRSDSINQNGLVLSDIYLTKKFHLPWTHVITAELHNVTSNNGPKFQGDDASILLVKNDIQERTISS